MANEKQPSPTQPNFDKWIVTYKDILEDGLIRYNSAFSMPTLQYISSVHLVATLWYNKLRTFKHQLTWLQVCKIGNKIKSELDDIMKPKLLHQYIPHLIILVGQELSNWIDFYDYYVFKKNKKKKSVAINYIDKIVWSPRGTINHLKTAKSMLEVKKSILYKNCIIVCAKCCASEDTLIGFPAFIGNLQTDNVIEEHNPMKFFWLNFMHRSAESWDELKANKCLYCFEREVSSYLRNTPASEYDVSVMFTLQYEFYIDYSCYIVSKLDENQQDELMDFGVFFDDIIPQFLMEPLYLDYFLPTLYHVRDDIPEENVCQILFDLNNLISDHYGDASKGYSYLYEKYVFFFQEIWSFLPDHCKDFVLDLEITAFDWIWQNTSLHLLSTYFGDCRPNVKRMLLFSARALNFCEDLIKNDQYEMFEKYVCPVFFTDNNEESDNLKFEFVREVKSVYWHFIKERKWSALDKFFTWSYSSETERMEQKKMLLRDVFVYEVDDYRFTSKMHYKTRYQCNFKPMNGVTNFGHFDELLKWCFNSKKEINKFKRTELCKTNNFTEIICDMIKRKRLDIIKQFLSWCFSNNEKLIRQFKKNFGNELASLEEGVDEPPPAKRRRLR